MFAKPAAELKMWFAGRLLGTGESGERDSGLRHAEAATATQAGRGEEAARCGSTHSKVSLLKDGMKRIQEDSTTKDMKGTKQEGDAAICGFAVRLLIPFTLKDLQRSATAVLALFLRDR